LCAVFTGETPLLERFFTLTGVKFYMENANLYVEFYFVIRYGDFQLRRKVGLDACQTSSADCPGETFNDIVE